MVASEEKIIAQNEPKNHQYSSAHFPLCSIDGCWIFRAFPRMLAIAPPAVFSRVFVGQYPKILAHMAIGQNYHWAHHFLGKHAFYVASLMILIWENETFRLGSSRCWNNGSNTLSGLIFSPNIHFSSFISDFSRWKIVGFFDSLLHSFAVEAPVLYFLLPVRSVKNEVEKVCNCFSVDSLSESKCYKSLAKILGLVDQTVWASRILWHSQMVIAGVICLNCTL